MIPRELVIDTLIFSSPPRVPRQLWLTPWARINHPAEVSRLQADFPDDLVFCPPFYRSLPAAVLDSYTPGGAAYRTGSFVDEWGSAFTGIEPGLMGDVLSPLLPDWSSVGMVNIPREYLSVDLDRVDAFCRSTDRFVIAGLTPGALPRPFERLQALRGPVDLLADLAAPPPEMLALLGEIHRFYVDLLEAWAMTAVDAIWFMDDWGSEQGMLVNPALWRSLFKPLYKDYIDLAHRHGKYAFMHSDGNILAILPDLLDLGLDAINCQVFSMGLDNLAPFRGRITFWGELDRLHILPHADPAEVPLHVRRMRESLYHAGGLIAQCEFGPGASPDNIRAYFDAW
jgi:uroporphyrinogen decarboxylase